MPASVLAVLLLATAATAAPVGNPTHAFDATTGEILIRTGRSGLLGFAGHRHRIRAERFEGTVTWPAGAAAPSELRVRIDATSLTVVDDDLDPGDVARVQADMESEVLETGSFPAISFTASGLKPDGDELRTLGTLELHGVSREITFPLTAVRDGDRVLLSGELRVRQSEHGIRPASAALGSVKVKDEVRVEFRVVAPPQSAPAPAPEGPLDGSPPSPAG